MILFTKENYFNYYYPKNLHKSLNSDHLKIGIRDTVLKEIVP